MELNTLHYEEGGRSITHIYTETVIHMGKNRIEMIDILELPDKHCSIAIFVQNEPYFNVYGYTAIGMEGN